MSLIDIIVVSYKDEMSLKSCLASIEKHCSDYSLFVEDNNKNNKGYTKAVNDGIKRGSAPFIWLLNSDAILKDNLSQKALIDRFSYHKMVGIVGSMQLDPDNPDIIKHCGTSRCFPGGVHKGGYLSMGHGRLPEKQTWVNGASMMIHREMLNQIGYLDENLFLIYSDSDYCYTARSKNFEVWYEPLSVIFHKLKASKTVTEWHRKDMEAFMKKWGITVTPEGSFVYSDLFLKLDMFP